ncbi:MAG: D-glycero-beta-D-manno-heptose 1,7-bisphosphate 7-phosphatase [Pseudomonadota bacterium]|nr:MAG: D-glycero-beta-D-manno-heptose 1,7-bisphosphate 7-phosphatase [Pseudomonadota bacterium]
MKLIILDRDGVINEDSDDYIKSPAEFIPIPGSLEAIARLNAAGYRVVVASNQSGIARGLFTKTTLDAIHAKLNRLLSEVGGKVDEIFFCPHGPNDGCNCRKPNPGLLHEIGRAYEVDLHDTVVIGDSLRDLQAAQTVGARAVLVRTGKGMLTLTKCTGLEGIPVYDSLAAYVNHLLGTGSD